MSVPSTQVQGRAVLKPKRAQPFFARHPWVFAGAIERVDGNPPDGSVVDLHTETGKFLARGFFNAQSKIRIRLFAWDESVELDRDFFTAHIRRAIALRHDILKWNTGADSAYRVVFSEADRLPGLVVDRYGSWLTMQTTSLALSQREAMLAEILAAELGVKGIFRKSERGIGKLEGIAAIDGVVWGEAPPPEIVIRENGVQFAVNLTEGQKTGFYLDQRDNRAAVAKYCDGKRMLDAFSYSGGFGLAAAKAGATEVVCVDASEGALALGQRNAELNGLTQLKFVKNDVFGHLDELVAANRKFDVVVLDPPKFARDLKSLPQALRGYRRLVQQALKLLGPDGILVKCCCTGLVTFDALEEIVCQTAIESKRELQILERRGPSADHPVSASCREGTYLKCLIARVG